MIWRKSDSEHFVYFESDEWIRIRHEMEVYIIYLLFMDLLLYILYTFFVFSSGV